MFLDQEIRQASADLSHHRVQLSEQAGEIREIVHDRITSPTVMIGSFIAGMGAGSIGSRSGNSDCEDPPVANHEQANSHQPSDKADSESIAPKEADRRVAEAMAESSSYQKHEWMRTLTRILAAPIMSYVLTHYTPLDDDSVTEAAESAT